MKSISPETKHQVSSAKLLRSVCAIFPVFAALSILYTSSVSAQTTPAHVCVVERDDLTGSSIFLENTCENNIDVKGMHNSNISCDPINASDKIPDDLIGIGNPATVCIEYSSDTLQTAAGFQGCDSVTISRCGQTGLTKVNPLRLPATIVLSDTETLNITEGDSGNFSVSLGRAPSGNVTVSLASTNADVTLTPTPLRFNTSNYRIEQRVTVNVADDDDAVNDSATITLSATGYTNATKSVTITDNDSPALDVTPVSLSLTEGGQALTFRVKLQYQPSANVTINMTGGTDSRISLDTDPNTAGNQNSLTFNRSGQTKAWDAYQTVSVSATHDADTDDESFTITAVGAGGDYQGVSKSISISIADDDNPSGTIQVAPSGTLSVNEGSSGTFDVSLSAAPKADVRVSLSKTNDDITLSPTSLTFTAGSGGNWNRPQRVTVNAAVDADTTNDSDTITLSATGGIDADDVTKSVSVTDNGTPSGTIVLDSTAILTVDEGGSETFTVRLSAAPSGTTTLRLSSSNSDISLDEPSLTFDAENYRNPRTVTVLAAHDDDANDEVGVITIAASGGIIAPNVTRSVSVNDDEVAGTIVLDPAGTLEIDEGGSKTFSVSLSAAPNAAVTVSLSKLNADVTLTPASLSFDTSDYGTGKTVTVAVAQDDDSAHESDTITLTASGGIVAPSLTKAVSIADDDTPSGTIQVTPAGTQSINEGRSGTFDVSLSAAPNADVRVLLAVTGNSDITVSETSLTFTTQNWRTRRTVSVISAYDADAQDDSGTITLTATGGIIAPIVTKQISVIDSDEASPGSIVLSPAVALSVFKGGSDSFEVNLSSAPSSDVTVTLENTNKYVTLSPTSLTFTSTTYATGQDVSVTVDANAGVLDDTDTITLTAAGGIEAPSVTYYVYIIDSGNVSAPPGRIQVSPTGRLSIDEGGSGRLDISLSVAPISDVTVSLSKSNADITLSPASLTFTSSNYSNAQAVTVSARHDGDTTNDSDRITFAASGGIDAPNASKSVSVIDDEGSAPAGSIVLSPAGPLTIDEGSSRGFGVSLSAVPGADVTLSLSSDNPDVSISPPFLIFTPSDHSDVRLLVLSVAQDDDETDESAVVTLRASGGIDAPAAMKEVRIVDNDKPSPPPPGYVYDGALVITPAGGLVVAEGGEGSIDVRLGSQPDENVSVFIEKTSQTLGIGFSPESMVFTPTNWNEGQSIKVVAHEDADKNDSVHTISFEFAGRRLLRTVIVRDDDKETLKTYALAIPPAISGDAVSVRISCRQDSPCTVALDCTAQTDGEVFEGYLPAPIPAWGDVSLSSRDIQDYTGGKSWSGKGRLGCALRSSQTISSQVWTRSGDGVLVNNSALIRSAPEGEEGMVYRADIESIPSPDASDESNIRIRCNSGIQDCLETSFVCYSDEGRRYDWELGSIERLTTRHLQSEELASGIGYRWEGLGLACEIRSKGRFTAQVLTRTGGGGALVNNSATGVR